MHENLKRARHSEDFIDCDSPTPSHTFIHASLMQPTFGFALAAPTPGARVFIGADWRRTWLAPDGRVPEVVQRVVRDIVFEDVIPHVTR